MVWLSAVLPASADPVSDKQRQASQIADQIEHLGDVAADLGEAYNGAVLKLQHAQAQVDEAQAKLDDLDAKLSSETTAAQSFAVQAYMYADSTGGIASLLAGTSLSDGSAQREGYNTAALGNVADVTDNMKAVIEDANREKAVLDAAKAQQARLADATKNQQKAALAAQAKQEQALSKVKGELAVLVQQEQKRRADAAAAQAQADKQRAEEALQLAAQTQAAPATTAMTPAAGSSSGSSAKAKPDDGPPAVDVPATSPGAAAAVRAALSQLGVPYRFAASSPGVAFDCSGLTMWAWAQAGVSMAHFAAAQYASFPHVPTSELQPGDLVFFYSDLHHVGIYIGNGQYVQAPRTGDVVKISPLAGRNLVGAARP
jgi:cell wall-associated NlpC family hydrolase